MDSEVVEFLNTLGEAERAGGRVLHDLVEEASSLELKELLRKTGSARKAQPRKRENNAT